MAFTMNMQKYIGIKRRFMLDFTCTAFITTLNFQASKLSNFRNRKYSAFACTDFIKNLLPSKAFTMAEILISLTIIGIIAAITLPALQANINEKTWTTKRKALYSRLSQALSLMPSLNGYGIGANNTETANNAAIAFVTDGLSQVLKINNICGNSDLKKCGLSDRISKMNNSKMNFPKKLSQLWSGVSVNFPIINTLAAGMETANGESIAVFYNPNCVSKEILYEGQNSMGSSGYYVKQHVCANFIYDLNGRKGPNKVGKDIGYITAIYPVDPEVTMVLPVKKLSENHSQTGAIKQCKMEDSEYRVPNREEALSTFYNSYLNTDTNDYIWTSTAIDETNGWMMVESQGLIVPEPKTYTFNVLCVRH